METNNETVAKLISHRGYNKGIITRINNFIISNKLSEYTYEALQERRARLVEAYQEYEKLNMEILAFNPDDDEDYETYEKKRAVAIENSEEFSIHQPSNAVKAKMMSGAAAVISCKFCQAFDHRLYQCAKFKLCNPKERVDFVNKNKLCIICLNFHKNKCIMKINCSICKKTHNSLLHIQTQSLNDSSNMNLIKKDKNSAVVSVSNIVQCTNILLPTVMVRLIGKDGKFIYARAFLDSGSQVSFITTDLAAKILCCKYNSYQTISGIMEGLNNVSQKADVTIYSSNSDFSIKMSCCIVNNITCDLPQQTFNASVVDIPPYINLADKYFNQTMPVSLLIGCDIFFQVIQRESIPVSPSGPFLVNTSFGYVVAGSLPVSSGKVLVSNSCVTVQGNHSINLSNEFVSDLNDINKSISKFWECEKVPCLYIEDVNEHQLAEQIFKDSVVLKNKRFSVALPLKLDLENVQLGDSFHYSLQRFYNLEKRLMKDDVLYAQYKRFMHDYLLQGHGKYIDINYYNLKQGNVYFIPHHAVLNPNSKTTPVRAVFDASMKTNNGKCLNDVLLNGPVVQSELFDILILFRTYEFVLLSDIKAMYRQVLINNKYCCLQNILWRDSQCDSVKCVQLQTVTYGLKSSAFLATRCLKELALRYKHKYPLASFVLEHSTYVDDVLCGSNDWSEIINIKDQLILLLQEGSFELHKWCSNHKDLLKDIPTESHTFKEINFDKNNQCIKTLGLSYDVGNDTLNMKCPKTEVLNNYTKRQVLSFISTFFDPLGLIGPILVKAKYIMQQIWYANLKWDDILPNSLNEKWFEFAKELVEMSCISIPRNINIKSYCKFELVGFADASNIAYGCCLYIRIIDLSGNVKVNLLCSKSRINPKDKNLTVPRLELNSALLLALLVNKVHKTLSLKYDIKTFLYLDSQIVLAWLETEPVRLNMYVASRVQKIKKLTENFLWFYVRSKDNPADILAKGMSPSMCETKLGQLWFHGPEFLLNNEYTHSNNEIVKPISSELPEVKTVLQTCNACNNNLNSLYKILEKFSDIEKLTIIFCYIKRFINNCKQNTAKCTGNLSPLELTFALHTIINLEQRKYFSKEIQSLKENVELKSNLNNLNPFIDSEGLLRVGGRLSNSNLPFSQCYPIILPKKSFITRLIILKEHLRLKHAGLKLVLSSLSDKYWLIDANREIKSVLHKCIICFKLKAKAATQLMGALPVDRVNITRPFQIVGTDYAGPFYIKQSRIRKPVITKAYVVIFVCFTTKAIHIELASDMTTNTFLASLKRFVSRRNKPTKIYCDNAAYYKGANNVLNELFEMQNSGNHQNQVFDYCNSERIAFHFIPSYSPVFGGLWEAGIKSIKFHLKRVVANSVLTYEELYTVLVQIESILNSRPLTPMSRDQDDMSYLTPGHFLTGSSLVAYPELNLTNVNVGKLSFWKQCTQMQQHFWKQWHSQYLVMLQSRPKWKGNKPNLDVGTMVLLKEDNISPLNWPVGRIVNVLPGKDGKVRALDVKTSKGSIIRTSLMKVCPFPLED